METLPEIIRSCTRRPVAVFGMGVSGKAMLSCLTSHGAHCVAYDEKPEMGSGVHPLFGEREARLHDLVVYSPGFHQDHPWLAAARQAGVLCLGEMDFAALFWHGILLAITGTNGKTTLTDFLAAALRANGGEAVAVGNIGQPLSNIPEVSRSRGCVAVCEVSSFQAEGLHYLRPQAVLWTNFEEDHLDRYPDMKAYFAAKWNLVERLSRPRLFIGEQVEQWARRLGYVLPPFAKVVRREGGASLIPQNSFFTTYPQQENYLIARAYWESEGLPVSVLEETAKRFSPRKHRLCKVAEIGGASYWNDSKGTNFHAVEAALRTFEKPVLWIGGGKSKGGDLDAFVGRIAPRVSHAFLVGETAEALAHYCAKHALPHEVHPTLEAATKAAFHAARPGDTVLFSPGFSSFDQFANYAERGVCFETCVLGLKQGALKR